MSPELPLRKRVANLIFELSGTKTAFDELENYLSNLSRQELGESLIQCGVLPEAFKHNGSEEKLWAKFTDILLAHGLNNLGIKTKVLGARGNSADVRGETDNYSIVGDAKTFRLSRTAKNQKDFKISALDTWRKENTYSLLLAPLLQYPNTASQIYSQAIKRNVTLISYTHLHFLLTFHKGQDLQLLWRTGERLANTIAESDYDDSKKYWSEINKTVCQIVGQHPEQLAKFRNLEIEKTKDVGNEGVSYWKDRIVSFNNLSKEEAVKLLIKAEKIEAKIKTIQRAISIQVKE